MDDVRKIAEVTQADRDAAKRMDRQNLLSCYYEEAIDAGNYDHVPAIQQFAAHREAAEKAERQAVVDWVRSKEGDARWPGASWMAGQIERGDHRKG